MSMLEGAKLLRVDLTNREISVEEIPQELIRRLVGGKGLGAYYLLREVKPKTDPLSPENKLIFMTGPVTGFVPGTSRYVVVTKSPLTDGWLDSYSGGHFPAELRFSGYWGIIFEGRSDNWVVLKIEEGRAELIDAQNLKGKDIFEVHDYFEGYKVAAIGPAGENLVRIACITNDYGRQAGRGGAGAVMGSKKVKAIIVKAKKPETPEKLKELTKFHLNRLRESEDHSWARDNGTPIIVDWSNEVGVLPTRNFTEGVFEGADKINVEELDKFTIKKPLACYLCSVACSRKTRVPSGIFEGYEVEGPEYETIALGGSNTAVGRLDAIIAFNNECDKLGLDTISAGEIIAWAMECTEKGVYDFGIKFGDAEGLVDMVRKIAYREGVGDILAEGVMRASRKVGGEDFAVHIKGMEIPGYDPRGSFGMALAYATADRGGDHLRSWPIAYEAFGDMDPFTTEGKAEIVVREQNENSVLWSLTSCDFVKYTAEEAVEILNAAGFNLTVDEYLNIGERIYNMSRLFNVREGFDRSMDTIPKRFTEPLKKGPTNGKRVAPEDFERMLGEYYKLRGWDKNGVPTQDTLNRLGLKELLDL